MAEKGISEKTLEAYGDVFADIVNGLLLRGRKVLLEQALTKDSRFEDALSWEGGKPKNMFEVLDRVEAKEI